MEQQEDTSTQVTQDERIMAALAHTSVILPFWGLVGAIVIWATQREKSRFIGFQALQAVAYQMVLLLGIFLAFGCYMCSFFGVFLAPLGAFAAIGTEEPNLIGLLSILPGFFPFCLMGLLMVLGFAFVLYGLYGALQVLQGHNFRYAIIGRRLEEYLSQ